LTRRYGGNTSCVELVGFEQDLPGAVTDPGAPRIILDGGTGLDALQRVLMQGPCGRGEGDLYLLLSHYHWDHLIGLAMPFKPAVRRGNRIVFYGGRRDLLRQSVGQVFKSVYSPIRQEILAQLEFRELTRDGDAIAGFNVRTAENRHPGGSLSFRIEFGEHAVAYSTDHEVGDRETDRRLVDLARGVQLWILDAQYGNEERQEYDGWGHSTHLQAVQLALEAGVEKVALYHHDPGHSDDDLDRMGQEAQALAGTDLGIFVSRDGMAFEIGRPERKPHPLIEEEAARG
jgi:ribonuclease BN (tRNA processing enzyme)